MENRNDYEKEIGKTIRQVRIHKGYSLEDVAAKANLSPNSVRALELGSGSSLSTMIRVLKVLDGLSMFTDWIDAQQSFSPLDALRQSRNQSDEPKRVSRKKDVSGI
ncbi:MAG: helix-turn-helix domain-containing protein [Clostridiales Family XIII bacterium]|jgi:transcriptional regulator with XRE-family HTH domain|nr:helix-turn-helix domain-containing protein [Clostridiales Family XIII bacterium]